MLGEVFDVVTDAADPEVAEVGEVLPYLPGIYADKIRQFAAGDAVEFFMLVQTTAIAGSVIFGFVTDKVGEAVPA